MEKLYPQFLKLLVLVLIISSCTPEYIPNVVNTPLLSNKGEVQAAVNSSLSGFDPQLAVAVSDNIGIMLNGSFANRTSDSTDSYHRHQFIEIAPGYYKRFNNNGRFEIYGGGGYGKLNSYYENEIWNDKASVEYLRFFIQPNIGATFNIFDGSFSTRLVMVDMYQGSNKDFGLYAEPIFTSKLGFKYIKVIGQLGISIPLNGSQVEFDHQPVLFSIGLQATLGKKWDD